MPDYNPAVAAGIQGFQAPQNNFTNTLGTIANLQEKQALTGYYTLQGLQQQRQYNALMAGAAEMRNSGDARRAAQAVLDAGGGPEVANQFVNYGANLKGISAAGGMLPGSAEQLTAAARNRQETSNLAITGQKLDAERQQADINLRGSVAQGLYNNPTPESARGAIAQLRGHITPDGEAKLNAAAASGDPEQIKSVAAEMYAAHAPAADVAGLVQPGSPTQGPRLITPQQKESAVAGAKATAEVPAELNKDLQAKAQGGIEAIQRLTRLEEAVNKADPKNFGSMLGSETAREYQPVPSLAAEHDNLKALYTDAGSAMLKSRYGARVTNMDVTQGMKIVGGTTVQNKATALKIIANNKIEAYDNIWNGLKRGVVDPGVLARPNSKQEADALGPGAVWIAPDGSPRRNAK